MTSTKKVKKPGQLRHDIWLNRSKYIMMLPAVVVLFIFAYIPMYGILMAFKDYSPMLGTTWSPFNNFEHFKYVFKDEYFWNSVKNTIVISFWRILIQFPAPILLALLLNECRFGKYRKVIQTLFTFPNFLSWIIAGGILKNFLRSDGFVQESPTALRNLPD